MLGDLEDADDLVDGSKIVEDQAQVLQVEAVRTETTKKDVQASNKKNTPFLFRT